MYSQHLYSATLVKYLEAIAAHLRRKRSFSDVGEWYQGYPRGQKDPQIRNSSLLSNHLWSQYYVKPALVFLCSYTDSEAAGSFRNINEICLTRR